MSTPKIYSRGPPPSYPKVSVFSHIFSSSAQPDTPAIIDATTGASITRRELESQSLQLAYGLRHLSLPGQNRTLNSNDAILLFSPNHVLYPLAYLACFAAGIPVAAASSASVPAELAHALRLTECVFYIVHPALLGVFEGAMKIIGVQPEEYLQRTVLLQSERETSSQGTKYKTIWDMMDTGQTMEPVRFDGDDAKTTCLYWFSSGTTGLPKAVEISHRNIVMQGEASKLWGTAKEGDVIGTPLPLFHAAAGMSSLFLALIAGATCVTWSSFTFDSYLEGLVRYKIKFTVMVPPMLAAFSVHPAVLKADLRHLQYILAGAAPISPYQLEKTYQRLKSIAHPDLIVAQAYGMSETCSTTFTAIPAQNSKWASFGAPHAGVEVRLVRDDDSDAELGEPGELWQRGDFVMNGYLRNPAATADALTSDGWLRTGDVCTIDEDGFLYVVDRRKEPIKYKGFQVPPAELEAVLSQHPGIADACVIGVRLADSTDEVPRAFVSLRDQSLLSSTTLPQEIVDWIKPRVSHYKQLRGGVVLVPTVPRTASGKILRRQIRELNAQRLDQRVTTKL